MPYYSDELVEEVRSRNDIVDVIGSYVHLQKKGSTYFGLCPFHNEKTGSFSVSPNKQMYYCFGCGAGGNVFTFLMQYENFTFPEAMQELADRVGIELPKQEMTSAQRREADRRTQLLEINKEAAKYFYMLLRGPRGQRAHEYFKKRELSDETMQKFGLGYSAQYSDDLYKYLRSKGYDDEILKETGLVTIDEVRGGHDKFWNRAMFPIMDVHNRVIGFGGRVMGDGEPKYLNSPETKIFDKSRNLYGLNIARSTRKNQLLLCEGYMDVIALHQAGFDEFIKALGAQEYEERIKKAENSFMFQIRIMQAGYDMDDPESKTAFYNEIAKKLLGFTEELERTNYTQAVSREYSIPYDDLRKLVNSMAMKGGIVKPQTKLKSGINEKNKKEDGMKQSQKLLLTWLIEDNSLFDRIKGRISADDFTEELYHKVAEEVFSQYETTHTVNPARIVSMFTDEDEQREVAGLFNATIHQVEGKNDKATALRETVIRIKQNSIDYRSKHLAPTDMEGMMRIIEDKRALEELQKIPE